MTVVLATDLPGAGGGGGLPTAASVAVACASSGGGVLFAEVGGDARRGPTMLASAAARELEDRLRAAGVEATARGRLCWATLGEAGDALRLAIDAARPFHAAIVHLAPAAWREAIEGSPRLAHAALVHAVLPAQRALAALLVDDLREAGIRLGISSVAPGRVGARRALAGIEAGGEAGDRAVRIARRLVPPPAEDTQRAPRLDPNLGCA
jgi:hypothetical protein